MTYTKNIKKKYKRCYREDHKAAVQVDVPLAIKEYAKKATRKKYDREYFCHLTMIISFFIAHAPRHFTIFYIVFYLTLQLAKN
jgi:hypothetical protein